jgi:hypothetical protein
MPEATRRRFARNAIAGSAVLLSLGNRAAWGQDITCVSTPTFESFAANGTIGSYAPPLDGKFNIGGGLTDDVYTKPQTYAKAKIVYEGPNDYVGPPPASQETVCTVPALRGKKADKSVRTRTQMIDNQKTDK